MDIGQFHQMTEGTPFVPMVVPQEIKPEITDEVLDYMTFFFEEGCWLGRSLLEKPLKRSVGTSRFVPRRVNYRAQKRLENELEEYTHDWILPNGRCVRLGMVLMLLLGVRESVREIKASNHDFSTVRCLATQVFVRFLIELDREDRKNVWENFDSVFPCDSDWRPLYGGAMAMARLIFALNQQKGVHVFLPPVFYNFHFSGDLIAVTPSSVLFIQARARPSNSGQAMNKIISVTEKTTVNDYRYSSGEEEKEKLLKGAQRFAEDTGVPVIPVLAEISLVCGAMWDITYPALNFDVVKFLNSLTDRP